MEASTSYSVQPPLLFRKRTNPSGSDSEGPSSKFLRETTEFRYYYVLESESDIPSEEDTESIYSVQDRPTDSAKDTSDLSTSEEDVVYTFDSPTETTISHAVEEYEPASLSEAENAIPGLISSESDGDDIVQTKTIDVEFLVYGDDEDSWADTSLISSDCEPPSIDSEIELTIEHTQTDRYCVQCHAKMKNKLLRFCEKCFKIRKNFFPPRPKGKNKKKKERKPRSHRKKKKKNGQSSLVGENDRALPLNQSQAESVSASSMSQNLSQNPGTSSTANNNSIEDCASNNSTISLSQASTVILDSSSNSCILPVNGCNSVSDLANKSSLTETDNRNSNNSLGDKIDFDNLSTASTVMLQNSSSYQTSSTSGIEDVRDKASSFSSCDLSFGCDPVPNPISSTDNVNSKTSNAESVLCDTCLTRPKNGLLLHGKNLGHMFCCYQCAKKLWRDTGRCPLCNCRITQVVKVIW